MEGSNELAKAITKKIFEKFDADNSGTIDKAEAKTIFMDELKKGGTTKAVFDEEAAIYGSRPLEQVADACGFAWGSTNLQMTADLTRFKV